MKLSIASAIAFAMFVALIALVPMQASADSVTASTDFDSYTSVTVSLNVNYDGECLAPGANAIVEGTLSNNSLTENAELLSNLRVWQESMFFAEYSASVMVPPMFTDGMAYTVTAPMYDTSTSYMDFEFAYGTYHDGPGNVGNIVSVQVPRCTSSTPPTTVLPPTSPLVALDDAVTTTMGTPVTVFALTNDYSTTGAYMELWWVGTQMNGVAYQNGMDTLEYVPDPGFVGTDSFNYSISDALGNQASATVSINVEEPSTGGLTALDDVAATPTNTAVIIPVTQNDSCEGMCMWGVESISTASFGIAELAAGEVIYTPFDGFVGVDSFTYTLTDYEGNFAVATVTVTVGGSNQAPVAVDDVVVFSPGESSLIDVLANDFDVDGNLDSSTLELLYTPMAGTASVENGQILYTALTSGPSTVWLAYGICDLDGLCDTAEVAVEVNVPANQAPVTVDGYVVTFQDTPITVDVLEGDHDPDGDPLYLIEGPFAPINGTVTINPPSADGSIPPTLTFTPNPGFVGEASATYGACDPAGLCAVGNLTVMVNEAVTATDSCGNNGNGNDNGYYGNGTKGQGNCKGNASGHRN